MKTFTQFSPTLLSALCGTLLLGSSLPAMLSAQSQRGVVLNEVVIDSRGPNTTEKEFIELYSTQPNTPLGGLSVITIVAQPVPEEKLQTGAVVRRFDLPANARTNSQGFYLIANENTVTSYGVQADFIFPQTERLTNESQTVALVDSALVPAKGQLVQESRLSPQSVHDAVAITDAAADRVFFFNAPVLGPDRTYLAAGALRVRDGLNTGDRSDWALADIEAPPQVTYNTPGRPNTVGGSAVVTDAPTVAVDQASAAQSLAQLPTGSIASQVQNQRRFDWKIYDPADAMNSLNANGNVFIYARSRRYAFCDQFERSILLHPAAIALMADNPKFFLNVDDPGYGRLATDIGIYRVPMMAFKRPGGEWEYIVITPETTGQEIQAFLSK